MTYLDQDATAIVRAAQLIVINAKWHICEEEAVHRMAQVRGLACTPLFPGHDVIQIVACHGVLLGRVRRHHDDRGTRWVATPTATAHDIGTYRTPNAAARALARRARLHRRRVRPVPV